MPTIKDVAAAAGVSITAVSKVLHGRGENIRVGKKTAASIREAAERLNYHPNALAQGLRTNRTHTVGLVFEKFGDISAGPLYYVHLLDGVAKELFSRHYRLTILPEVDDDDVAAALGDGRLDGVIWCKLPRHEGALNRLQASPIPIVAIAPPPATPHDIVFVSCENEAGAGLAVHHLADLGHRHIGFVMETGETDTPDALARADGFLAAAAQRGLPVGPDDVLTWSRDALEFPEWWATAPKQTALLAWNERVAAAVLAQAAHAGVRVPEDLSVVGFDSTPFCDTTSPRLSAVRQPIREIARHATIALLDLIAGRQPMQYAWTFGCSFDVRESTAPPRFSPADTTKPRS